MLTVGEHVDVYSGLTQRRIAQATVQRISPQGRIAWLSSPSWGGVRSFYRTSDCKRYVRDPGCGIAGAILNDYVNPKES